METDPTQSPTEQTVRPVEEPKKRRIWPGFTFLELAKRRIWPGFTFLELAIVVAILWILWAVGMSQYPHYHTRVRARAALDELQLLKSAVEGCAMQRHTLAGCSQGSYGIPSTIQPGTYKYVHGDVRVEDGIISAQAPMYGEPISVTLTPSLNQDQTVKWAISGEICNEQRYRITCNR